LREVKACKGLDFTSPSYTKLPLPAGSGPHMGIQVLPSSFGSFFHAGRARLPSGTGLQQLHKVNLSKHIGTGVTNN